MAILRFFLPSTSFLFFFRGEGEGDSGPRPGIVEGIFCGEPPPLKSRVWSPESFFPWRSTFISPSINWWCRQLRRNCLKFITPSSHFSSPVADLLNKAITLTKKLKRSSTEECQAASSLACVGTPKNRSRHFHPRQWLRRFVCSSPWLPRSTILKSLALYWSVSLHWSTIDRCCWKSCACPWNRCALLQRNWQNSWENTSWRAGRG